MLSIDSCVVYNLLTEFTPRNASVPRLFGFGKVGTVGRTAISASPSKNVVSANIEHTNCSRYFH